MVQERQRRGKGVCWMLRLWSVAVISILLLSACFVASCVLTYQFTTDNPNRRLFELHTYHSSISCFSEGTMVSEKMWGCCPNHWKPFGSSCYLISTKENFWSISEQNCVEMGAHLVVINTEAEQALAITPLLPGFYEFDYFRVFMFWHPNEPNSPAERCASIVFWNPAKWAWNDVLCDTKRRSICEMKKIYL
nr:C-type lectin domain family 6 member A [Meriones unguiculatus]